MLDLLRDGCGTESWVPAGELGSLRFDRDEIMVAVERDDDELARRRHHGLGALPNRRALQVLLSMPTGVAVPVTFLRSADLRLLLSLPTGVVDLDGTDVRVALRPAVSLLSVGVVARTWKQGLEGVSPFASYCARYVVLDGGRDQQARGFCVAEARYFGVGLAVHRGGAVDWLVAPAKFQATRFSPASWLMAERLTAKLWASAG